MNWVDELTLKFAIMEFYSSDGHGGDIQLSCQFHGEGPSDNLRECRHTYWGEEGYLFYPNGPVIIAGFKALSEFYDGMITTDS